MRGESQGSGAGRPGHTPSLSPPRIVRSALCSRASIRPRIASRGCPPCGGRTATSSISVRSIGTSAAGSARGGPPAASRSSSSSRSAAARPSARVHSPSPASACAASRNAASSAGSGCGPAANTASSGASRSRATGHQPCAARRNARSRPSCSARWRSIPASPGAGRGPRSARSSRRTPSSQPSRSSAIASGCLSNASKGSGAKPCAAASASASSSVPGGSTDSGWPAESSIAIPQRAQCARDSPGERAVGRHQRGGPPGRFEHFAQRQRDRLRLLGRVGDFERAHARQPPLARGQRRPAVGQLGRLHRRGDRLAARGRRVMLAGGAPGIELAAADAHPVEQLLELELRMRLDAAPAAAGGGGRARGGRANPIRRRPCRVRGPAARPCPAAAPRRCAAAGRRRAPKW